MSIRKLKMNFVEIFKNHKELQKRQAFSTEQLKKITTEFNASPDLRQYKSISVYCGGSLGRGEAGTNSDLDLFILSNNKKSAESRLDILRLLSEATRINSKLGFPEFSNDGQYLRVYSFPDMLNALGSPRDDNENLFTVRMLLILESKSVFNEDLYSQHIEKTLGHYFRDSRGRSSFRPLFLLNDLLRYWRTVCLNYELIRDDPKRPWRKKNINLKFSRMLTVFGTVLPIIAKPATNIEYLIDLVNCSPMECLARGLDILGDHTLKAEFRSFLSHYEKFLVAKEKMGTKLSIDDATLDRTMRESATEFSDFLFKCLTHNHINRDFVKYLIL